MTLNAFGYSDAAKRCADTINMHVLAGAYNKWAAIRLSDGGSDGIAYDKRVDAIRHQLHEHQCCYILIPLVGMSPMEAEVFMKVNRDLYDKGMRLGDPQAKDVMVPIRWENVR